MLRTTIAALGGLALYTTALLGTTAAQARECVTGWITHIDRQNDTISLDSGEILHVSGDVNFETLEDGMRVKLVVKATEHGLEAVSVAPAATPSKAEQTAGRV